MSIIALSLMGAAITVMPTGADHPQQVAVKYGDLNLSTIEGRANLDKRLDLAVRIVCGDPRNEPLYRKMIIRKCVTRTVKDITPQRDLAVAKFDVRLASRN